MLVALLVLLVMTLRTMRIALRVSIMSSFGISFGISSTIRTIRCSNTRRNASIRDSSLRRSKNTSCHNLGVSTNNPRAVTSMCRDLLTLCSDDLLTVLSYCCINNLVIFIMTNLSGLFHISRCAGFLRNRLANWLTSRAIYSSISLWISSGFTSYETCLGQSNDKENREDLHPFPVF